VHLYEAYLGIYPHFGLWKYLYHCKSGMAGGEHQVVGGASLKFWQGRKVEYLDIPLKDIIEVWHFEWCTMENLNKCLPAHSRRQPDVYVPNWIEAPTDSKVAKAKVLLAEITDLKDRGLTFEAVVTDFVFNTLFVDQGRFARYIIFSLRLSHLFLGVGGIFPFFLLLSL
jgi:hypothetical protein